MYVYNTTIKVDYGIIEEWIQWQKEVHIPEILSIGFFYDYRFYELPEQNDSEGKTFVIQYFALQLEDYSEYNRDHAQRIAGEAFKKWGEQFISFSTLLKTVQ